MQMAQLLPTLTTPSLVDPAIALRLAAMAQPLHQLQQTHLVQPPAPANASSGRQDAKKREQALYCSLRKDCSFAEKKQRKINHKKRRKGSDGQVLDMPEPPTLRAMLVGRRKMPNQMKTCPGCGLMFCSNACVSRHDCQSGECVRGAAYTAFSCLPCKLLWGHCALYVHYWMQCTDKVPSMSQDRSQELACHPQT